MKKSLEEEILEAVDHWQRSYHSRLLPGNMANYIQNSAGYEREEVLAKLREMTGDPFLQDIEEHHSSRI